MLEKQLKRQRRHRRARAKIKGTAKVPRLCVFRSAKHIYAQLINDEKGETLAVASDLEVKKSIRSTNSKIKTKKSFSGKTAKAYEVGKLIAKKALGKKVDKIVFDRGGYKYHGKVKALAGGAREAGLKF